MYYLEYSLESNRNWLTAKAREDFILTFSVRNNSNKNLPHGLMLSCIALDGTNISLRPYILKTIWPHLMKSMLKDAKLGNKIEPGQLIRLSRKFNDFLTNSEQQRIIWKVQSFTMETKVTIRP